MNLDIDPWIARLEAKVQGPQALRAVEGLSDLGVLRTGAYIPPCPAVFVAPDTEAPDSNDADNGLSQRVTETVSVVTAVSNVRDRGRSVHQQLTAIRRATKDALLLWVPDAESSPVELARAGGALWFFDDRIVLWRDRFSTVYLEYLTEPLP